MARFTVRLPETLHQQVIERAESEGVSVNQYILFCLTRVITVDDIKQQQEEFNKLLTQYPSEDAENALTSFLKEREESSEEDPKLREKIASKIKGKQKAGG